MKWDSKPQLTGLLMRIKLDRVHEARLLAQRRHATNVSSSTHTPPPLPQPKAKNQTNKQTKNSFARARPHSKACTPSVTLTGAPSVPGHKG